MYPSELYPLRVRGKAVALSTSANWALNFALAYLVPPAFAQITWKVYVLFADFCAAMFIHVFFLFPETSQKPLEEIERIFDDTAPGRIKVIGIPAWKTHVNKKARFYEAGEVVDMERTGIKTSHSEATHTW